ncbi:MAG: hypothetical protein ACLP7Q_10040 [Isosphaeraceae bacterium]
MNKLAVFVEGHTEAIFVDRLVEEVAGNNRVRIELRKIRGGSSVRRTSIQVRAAQPETGQQYYVLILDCGGDAAVKSRILEEHENLTRSGYAKILGLRDVRPKYAAAEIGKLERGLRLRIRTSLIPVQFILSIMEIEAWFLAEVTHFPRIHPSITVDAIRSTLGFDPENDDMEKRDNPAKDLADCYAIGGKLYEKAKAKETVDTLDFGQVYLRLPAKFDYLSALLASVDSFLA